MDATREPPGTFGSGTFSQRIEAAVKFSTSKRIAGLLVPVFALRETGDIGIGNTKAVREAIDFCRNHSFAVLQILPIHETIGDHSPYNPISSRALSPALLSMTPDEVPGLTEEMRARIAPEAWLTELRTGPVKHSTVHTLAMEILMEAHRAFRSPGLVDHSLTREFEDFQRANESWLPDYTLFRLLVHENEGSADWLAWRPQHRSPVDARAWLEDQPDRERLTNFRDGLAFVQWVAWRQWKAVRQYASTHEVLLMGELTFGVSRHSADAWAAPELFDLEWHMGTPPIVFFDTNADSARFGQNWGFPPYRWENHRNTGFAWLRRRLEAESQFFHVCRLDHLRGYFRAYMFPWDGGERHTEMSRMTEEEIRRLTANRWPHFVPGPDDDPDSAIKNEQQGREIISIIREAAGEMYFFAEIMGELPGYIAKTLDDLQVPNLIFPQLERCADRSLKPAEFYRFLSLVSYANHDHAPLAALYTHLREKAQANPQGIESRDLRSLLHFIGRTDESPPAFDDALLASFQRALFQTPSLLATLMSSDLLGVPQRFNLPGSYGLDTWNQRLEMPLAEFVSHPVYGPRVAAAACAIHESGRG